MTDWVLLPFGNAFLQATRAEFDAMLARGLAAGPISVPATPPVAGEGLLDSQEMGKRLGVTPEWCEAAAKAGDIPSVRVGRYLRFDPVEVLSKLQNGHADSRSAPHR